MMFLPIKEDSRPNAGSVARKRCEDVGGSSSLSWMRSKVHEMSRNVAIMHFKYLALAKNTSVLREAMLFKFEPQYHCALHTLRTYLEAMFNIRFFRLSVRFSLFGRMLRPKGQTFGATQGGA